MASFRELRRRIKSTNSTQQIMRAMQLVSASKFKRAQSQLARGRAMMEFLDGLTQRVFHAVESVAHPLCISREGPAAMVIMTANTGLCGSYNTNLINLAEAWLHRERAPERLIFIGKKGYSTLTKRGYQAQAYLDMASRPDVERIGAFGQSLMEKFLNGEFGSVQLLAARFVSAAVSRPSVTQWLPVKWTIPNAEFQIPSGNEPRDSGPEHRATILEHGEYIFEPSVEAVLEDLIPRWVLAKFQMSVLEAFASEHGARMVAMKNATDNADELVKALTHQSNQMRQTSITREISEIVGTGEALN